LEKGGKLYTNVGKWYTPCGFEVFPARDDWNYSRSLLYNFAEPFWHFGDQLYKYFNTTDFVMVNVNRGWNRVGGIPGNNNLGLGFSAGKTMKKLTTSVNFMESWEPDFVNNFGNRRYLFDLVMSYVASPKWSWALNADYWQQSDFKLAAAAPAVD